MRKSILFIMILVLECLLTGCRASLESKASQSRQHVDEIGVVLRRVDSLSSTISEKHNVKIEFYQPPYNTESPGKPCTGSPFAAAPSSTLPADSTHVGVPQGGEWSGFGSMGAVKSIEITSETEASTQSHAFTDSTAVSKTAEAETRQGEKASEARQDNGTVFIVSIVAAVALLVFFLLKTYLKK